MIHQIVYRYLHWFWSYFEKKNRKGADSAPSGAEVKGQDMTVRDPDEKGEIFQLVIFAVKNFLLMHNLPGSSMTLFSFFVLHTLGNKLI